MALTGHVEDLALADLLQLGAQHQRTCRIDLWAGTTSGAIFLERGVLVHAFIGSISAERALYVLLEQRDLRFEVHTGVRSSLRSMERTVPAALIEAACAQDAYAHGRGTAPTLEARAPTRGAAVSEHPSPSRPPQPTARPLPPPPPPAGYEVLVKGALLACLTLAALGSLLLALAPAAQ